MHDNYNSHFLSPQEVKYFQENFEAYRLDKDSFISYKDFKEIVLNRFTRAATVDILDKIRKGKDRQANLSDSEIIITRFEYFELLDQIYAEQNKRNNERDPELRSLFEILSSENSWIPKKKLADVILQFELSIGLEDFFYPIGKKEELYFEDFCILFKYSGKDDVFVRSLSKGSIASDSSSNNIFPVDVSKSKRKGLN